MTTQQGDRQAKARDIASTTETYNGDLRALFEAEATIAAGQTYNGAMISWLQERLGSSDDNLNNLMQAFAEAEAAHNWSSLGTFEAAFDNEEAETLVASMSAEPDNARKDLIDDLVGSLKAAGVWAKLDALWVIAAHDSQAASLNWRNPATFALTVGGGEPTFLADTHYAFDGSDDWIDTNFDPSTAAGNFTQNAASCGIWNRTTGRMSNACFGWFDGTDGISINPRTTIDVLGVRLNQASASNVGASATAAGFFTANRTASNAGQRYINGAASDTFANASTALNSATLRLGAFTAADFQASQIAAAFVGGSLDATEQDALYDALLTYMTAVGAVT